MTRVLLINPPSPEQLGAPLLGQQYVAASLLERGCEVRVVDAASRYNRVGVEEIVNLAEEFRPHIIGIGLFTRWVWHAYRLVDELKGIGSVLVAGGAHATVRPEETLLRGFDIAIEGEAEIAITRVVDWLEGKEELSRIPGAHYRDHCDRVRSGPPAEAIANLDALPLPMTAQNLFDPFCYHSSGSEIIPGGMLSSRGCPARCTFCANYVTGRGFRWRSAGNVVDELNAYHARTGATFFPFWDDALTANRRRLFELCDAIEHGIDFELKWSAITRASMVTPDLLTAMRRAGCISLNFGVESGDDEILRAIKKGITTAHVINALEMAKEQEFTTACNFMLGFPQEAPAALERTLEFMQRISPLVDSFSTLGVLVPFPGTPLYHDYHEEFGFTDWWLGEECSNYRAAPPIDDFDRFYRHYIDDANLELDFFHYSPEMVTMIRECMRFKGEHNLRKMGLLKDPVFLPAPTYAA